MPQLDFSTYASQIFWLILFFGILHVLLARFNLPTITKVLENRQQIISSNLVDAENFKNQAMSTKDNFSSELEQAKTSASILLDEILQNIKIKETDAIAKLEKKFEKQAKESEENMNLLRSQSYEQIVEVAVTVSDEIIKNLTNLKINTKKIQEVAKANCNKILQG